jgi:hypothetical protein
VSIVNGAARVSNPNRPHLVCPPPGGRYSRRRICTLGLMGGRSRHRQGLSSHRSRARGGTSGLTEARAAMARGRRATAPGRSLLAAAAVACAGRCCLSGTGRAHAGAAAPTPSAARSARAWVGRAGDRPPSGHPCRGSVALGRIPPCRGQERPRLCGGGQSRRCGRRPRRGLVVSSSRPSTPTRAGARPAAQVPRPRARRRPRPRRGMVVSSPRVSGSVPRATVASGARARGPATQARPRLGCAGTAASQAWPKPARLLPRRKPGMRPSQQLTCALWHGVAPAVSLKTKMADRHRTSSPWRLESLFFPDGRASPVKTSASRLQAAGA